LCLIIGIRKRTYPTKLTRKIGQVAQILCYSAKTKVKWYFKGKKKPDNIILTSPKPGGHIYILSIFKVNKHNIGQYRCFGQDTSDTMDTFFRSDSSLLISGNH